MTVSNARPYVSGKLCNIASTNHRPKIRCTSYDIDAGASECSGRSRELVPQIGIIRTKDNVNRHGDQWFARPKRSIAHGLSYSEIKASFGKGLGEFHDVCMDCLLGHDCP